MNSKHIQCFLFYNQRLNAIISCNQVTEEVYWNKRIQNYYDPYFSVQSIQEQKRYCLDLNENIIRIDEEEYSKELRIRRINYLMRKRRIQERYSISFN